MACWLAAGRVSGRRLVAEGSGQAWCVVSSWILGGTPIFRVASRSRVVLGMPVRWRKVPAGPVKVADGDALQLAAHGGPGLPGLVLRDADEEQGEPAEDDVGADALFEPVVDRAQVQALGVVCPGRSRQRAGGVFGEGVACSGVGAGAGAAA
jgi:hypothetical protein